MVQAMKTIAFRDVTLHERGTRKVNSHVARDQFDQTVLPGAVKVQAIKIGSIEYLPPSTGDRPRR